MSTEFTCPILTWLDAWSFGSTTAHLKLHQGHVNYSWQIGEGTVLASSIVSLQCWLTVSGRSIIHILTSNLDTLCLLNCLPKENSENHLTTQKRYVHRYTPVFCPIRWKCSKWKSMVLRSTCRKLYCSPQNHCVSNWWAKRWQEKEPETWLPLQQQVDADPEDLWTRLPLPNGTNGIALCNVVDPNRDQSCKAERPWGKRGRQASKKDSGKARITDTAVENVGLWPIVYQKKKQNWWSTWNGKIHLCKIVYRKA